MGLDPPTPFIPTIEEDLVPTAEQPHIAAMMPDPGSSSCAPTTQTDEWDGKTQVGDTRIIIGGLPSSKEVVEMLFKNMKEPVQTPERSHTYPGRERSLVLPVSFLLGIMCVDQLLTSARLDVCCQM